MKKILAMLLALILVFFLVSCRSNSNKVTNENSSTSDTSEPSAETKSEIEEDESLPTQEAKTEQTDIPENTVEKSPEVTHKHSFSPATCTEAAKCSCGSLNGNALGHNWQDATCESPKTCKRCGAKEGSATSHSYLNGICSLCGHTTLRNPKNDLDILVEFMGNSKTSGDSLTCVAIQFEGGNCSIFEKNFSTVQSTSSQKQIVVNGKTYYYENGKYTPYHIELTDTEIIVKGYLWGDNPYDPTIRLILQKDGTLKVTSSTNDSFPVGTIFSRSVSDILK